MPVCSIVGTYKAKEFFVVRRPWNRNRTRPAPTQVPTEVQEYYESTRKERTGTAWLLTLATFLITVILAVALFFGGSWIYQRFTSNDDQGQLTIEQQPGEQREQSLADDLPQGSGGADAPVSDPTTPPVTTPPPTPAPQPTQQTPTTGPSTPEIPRTGPTGDE